MSITPSRVPQVLLLLAFVVVTVFFVLRAKTGKPWPVRRLAGIDAIEDAMGRATEMNRPVSYMMGEGALSGADGSQTVASMCILPYVARIAARLNTLFFVQVTVLETAPAIEDICRAAYSAEGKLDKWDPTYGLRISRSDSPQCIALLVQENCAVSIMIGSIRLPSVTMAEEANRMGAMTIAATAAVTNVSFLVACCDYVILGDELFAAAAFISQDPMQISTVNTTDLFKLFSVSLVVIGLLLLAVGINISKIVYP